MGCSASRPPDHDGDTRRPSSLNVLSSIEDIYTEAKEQFAKGDWHAAKIKFDGCKEMLQALESQQPQQRGSGRLRLVGISGKPGDGSAAASFRNLESYSKLCTARIEMANRELELLVARSPSQPNSLTSTPSVVSETDGTSSLAAGLPSRIASGLASPRGSLTPSSPPPPLTALAKDLHQRMAAQAEHSSDVAAAQGVDVQLDDHGVGSTVVAASLARWLRAGDGPRNSSSERTGTSSRARTR
jgi:hypothetical protein